MKYTLLAIFGILIVTLVSLFYFRNKSDNLQNNAQNSTPITKINGWVHTKGMQLIDESGSKVSLVGLTANGMEIGEGYPAEEGKQKTGCRGWVAPTQIEYENFANWGFNSARVPLSWANLEPIPPTKNSDGSFTHNWNQRYVQEIDTIVAEFGKRGIPVIIGLHQFNWSPAFRNIKVALGNFCQGQGMPVWTISNPSSTNSVQAFCDFFAGKTEAGVPIDVQTGFIEATKFLANRYKDNSTVIGIDMFNEPFPKNRCNSKDLNLANFYQNLGSEIRSVNENILLIFEEGRSKSLKADFSLEEPIPFSNTIYAFHMYPKSFEVGKAISDAFLARAKKWNVPLWLGEWGAIGAQNNDLTDAQAKENAMLLTYLKNNNISFAYWAYWGGFGLTNKDILTKPKILNILQSGF